MVRWSLLLVLLARAAPSQRPTACDVYCPAKVVCDRCWRLGRCDWSGQEELCYGCAASNCYNERVLQGSAKREMKAKQEAAKQEAAAVFLFPRPAVAETGTEDAADAEVLDGLGRDGLGRGAPPSLQNADRNVVIIHSDKNSRVVVNNDTVELIPTPKKQRGKSLQQQAPIKEKASKSRYGHLPPVYASVGSGHVSFSSPSGATFSPLALASHSPYSLAPVNGVVPGSGVVPGNGLAATGITTPALVPAGSGLSAVDADSRTLNGHNTHSGRHSDMNTARMIWVPVTEAKKIMADVRSSDNRKHSSDVRSFDDRGKEEAAISLAAAPNKAPVALAKTPIATIPSPTVQSALPLPAPAAIPLPAPEAIPLPAPAAIPLPISGGLLDASSPAVLATSTSGATVLATSLAEDEEDDEDDVPFFISARAADLDAGLFHNFISSIGDFSEDATEDYEAASGDGDSLLVPLMILEGPPDLAEAAVVLQEELNHDGEDSETKSAAADFIAADLMKSEEAENAPAPASPTQTPVLRLRRSNGLVASLLRPRR